MSAGSTTDLHAPPDLAAASPRRAAGNRPVSATGRVDVADDAAPVSVPVPAAPTAAKERKTGIRTRLKRRRRRLSKLTARVLAINVLALIILVGGLLYLGQYEERLIQSELEALRSEAQIFAGALAEGATVGAIDEVRRLDPDLARTMIRRLHETTATRTRLFDVETGGLIADTRVLASRGGAVEIERLPTPSQDWLREWFDNAYRWINEHLPRRKLWPSYTENPDQRAEDYTSVSRALLGIPSRQIWTLDNSHHVVLGVAVPVQRLRVVLGAILVTRDSSNIEAALQSVREDILGVFAIALAITVALSLYMAGTITRPIRRLAQAAEQVRSGHGRRLDIPDFSRRRDEIGDLSSALREMTEALWARMDAIERFAADVAHEIKNPLTSLRSAVETVARVKDPEQQRKLMSIIQEDVTRLDRLITDISEASRVDAELSRAELDTIDIGRTLEMLVELYRQTVDQGGVKVSHTIVGEGSLVSRGLEHRLVQVFRNLITNAMTFSPKGGEVRLTTRRSGPWITVVVEDDGPGIPEAKLEAIFDRFYTDRPADEKFATHSGLGLSISKQIIEAHQGRIWAENRQDRSGARFTVCLPAE